MVDKLWQWASETLPTMLPSSSIAKAVTYMLKLWQGLTVFLSDPRIPIDNNHAEREIRDIVVGRENQYGSKSKRGAEISAIFYTIFESAKLISVGPTAYVLEAVRRILLSSFSGHIPPPLIDSKNRPPPVPNARPGTEVMFQKEQHT